jgi:hypothetical protein
MITKGRIRILSFKKDEEFKNQNGETIKFNPVTFCDEEGNKFSGTIPHANIDDVDLEPDTAGEKSVSVEGEATFNETSETRTTKGGESYKTTKYRLIGFKSQ